MANASVSCGSGRGEGNCLICCEEIKRIPKIPSDFGRKPIDAFLRICELLKVSFLEIQEDWGFSDSTTEPLPFCSLCINGFHTIIKLQNQLTEIQKKIDDKTEQIREKIVESSSSTSNAVTNVDLKAIKFRQNALKHGSSRKYSPSSEISQVNFPAWQQPQQPTPPTPTTTTGIRIINSGSSLSVKQQPEYNNFLAETTFQNQVTPVTTTYHSQESKYESLSTNSTFISPPPTQVTYECNGGYEGSAGSGAYADDNCSDNDNDLSNSSEIEDDCNHSKKSSKKPPKSKNHINIDISSLFPPPSSTPTNTSSKKDRQIETFSPIITSSTGQMTFEGIILTPMKNGYQCGQCNAIIGKDHSTISLRKAKIHIKGFHLGSYKCPTCSKNFTSNDILLQHLKHFHNSTLVPCPTCAKPLKHRNLRGHQFTHLNSSEQKLAIQAGFKRQSYKGEPQLECRICSKKYHNASKLKRHELVHVSSEFRKDFKCSHCDKAYTTEQGRKEHILAVHEYLNARKKLCKICGETVLARNLRKHEASCHLQLTCKNCEKSFATKANHRLHEEKCGKPRRKREDYQYECDICNKYFSSRSNMTNHRRKVHKSHWKLKVPIKLTNQISVDNPKEISLDDLNNEGIQHVEGDIYSYQLYQLEKKLSSDGFGYRCCTCETEFHDKMDGDELEDKVKEHVRSMHMGSFRCNLCTKRMKSLFEVEAHQRSEHLNLEGLDCEICGRTGISKKEIKSHLWRHKNIWEMAEAINLGESFPRWKSLKNLEGMGVVLKEMGVEVNLRCGVCEKERFDKAEELYRHRCEEHPEAPKLRVQRVKEPKKRGRKKTAPTEGSEGNMRKRKLAVKVVASEEESEMEEEWDQLSDVQVKVEIITPDNSEDVMDMQGSGRRSLRNRSSLRKKYNYSDSMESEEDNGMNIKKSPHSSEIDEWASDV